MSDRGRSGEAPKGQGADMCLAVPSMASRANHDYSRNAKRKPKAKTPKNEPNILIERDYAHGTSTKFETDFPPVLALRVRNFPSSALISPCPH